MAFPNPLQFLQNTAGSGSSIALLSAGTFSAGSYLDVITIFQNASNTVSSVSDGGTLTYTVDPNVPIANTTDATDGWRLTHYTSSQLAVGASLNPTTTFTNPSGFSATFVTEIANSSGFLNSNGQLQASPGTGTNGITSGSVAIPGSVPCLLLGFCANATGDHATTSAGNNLAYTDGGYVWGGLNVNFAHYEYVNLTGLSSAAAQFTAGVSNRRLTFGIVYGEAVALYTPFGGWSQFQVTDTVLQF